MPLFLVKSARGDENRATYFTLESVTSSQKLSFGALQSRLISFVKMRIQNGDLTERGLARLLGTSQSQLHNVLKGARKLQPEMADRLIAKFDIDILDLVDGVELSDHLRQRQPGGYSVPGGHIPGAHVPPKRFADERIPKKRPQSATLLLRGLDEQAN